MKFAAIADWADSESYPVSFMCTELGVSRSGYYAWCGREVSDRARTDAGLTALITTVHARLRGNPGSAAFTPSWPPWVTACPASGSGG